MSQRKLSKEVARIGILTSGGDAPGMNALIYNVAKIAEQQNHECIGFCNGYEGIINNEYINVTSEQFKPYIADAGSELRSSRSEAFRDLEPRKVAAYHLKQLNIDRLIVAGGDGTLRGLKDFVFDTNIDLIGVPATVDNDLGYTNYTLGFDSTVEENWILGLYGNKYIYADS